MKDILAKTIEFVDTSLGFKNPHLRQTLFWILKLRPDADEALQVSAYSHDIERAFKDPAYINNKIDFNKNGFLDKEMLNSHQLKSAEIMKNFLMKQNCEIEFIDKVYSLIKHHEVGGDSEQNLLKDADSISFLECNIDHFLTKYLPNVGKKKVQDKIEWMFSRITSAEAKNFANPYYKKAISQLKKLK